MNARKHTVQLLLALAVLCTSANAQSSSVPRLVNFSGKVADAQGKAISGVAGVSFAIYKDQYEGAPLWMETQNVQADAKGNYSVQLGASTPEGLPLDLFSSGETRWLGVTVNGGQEQPRVLLLSVPYALKAADAETVGGLPASAFVRANQAPGSGTSAKTAGSSGMAGKNANSPANPAVTGVGVANHIPMWDTTSDIVDSVMFQKSSQIGVNTTAPAATLDVNGKTDVRNTLTLFPNGTNSTLAVNGTAFKVDQTGKVTFISAQKFPGTGTVTSVGLSAPTSDFTVSGSPVTKSGTLALKWNVAPSSANTANAIVKRDSSGSFAAGTITTGTLSASFVGAANSSGAAINGTSTGTSAGSDGVDGVTTSGTASGVAGINQSGGIGVYGTGGTGVFGTGSNYGFQTDSHAQQARTAGGWVKAMALVTQNGVAICFNSTLPGASATTPPCGFGFHNWGVGDYTIDFGFEVDDRFVSATATFFNSPSGPYGPITAVCVNGLYGQGCNNAITANQVEIIGMCAADGFVCSNNYADGKFYVIVY